jgi:UDP-N-acetylglucosamine:LPS N-acetylglucosamine transferase
MNKIKVCIAFSAGGHYVEAMNACALLFHRQDLEFTYVTYKNNPVKKNFRRGSVHYVTHPCHCFFVKRFGLFLRNFFDSLRFFLKHRPHVVISTGADVTIGIMLIAKMFGSKLLYIETGANVHGGSLTGKLSYRLADMFIVQWPEQLKQYPYAILGGALL